MATVTQLPAISENVCTMTFGPPCCNLSSMTTCEFYTNERQWEHFQHVWIAYVSNEWQTGWMSTSCWQKHTHDLYRTVCNGVTRCVPRCNTMCTRQSSSWTEPWSRIPQPGLWVGAQSRWVDLYMLLVLLAMPLSQLFSRLNSFRSDSVDFSRPLTAITSSNINDYTVTVSST